MKKIHAHPLFSSQLGSLRIFNEISRSVLQKPNRCLGIVAVVLHCLLQWSGVCYTSQHGRLMYSQSKGRTDHALFSRRCSLVHAKNHVYLQLLNFITSPQNQWVLVDFYFSFEKANSCCHRRTEKAEDSLYMCNIVIKCIFFVQPQCLICPSVHICVLKIFFTRYLMHYKVFCFYKFFDALFLKRP